MAQFPFYLVDSNIIGVGPRSCAECPMCYEVYTCRLYRKVIKGVDPKKKTPRWCKLLSVTLVMSTIDPGLVSDKEEDYDEP